MRTLKKNIKEDINWNDSNIFQIIIITIFAIISAVGFSVFSVFEYLFCVYDTETNILIGMLFGVTIPTSIYFSDKYRKRNGALYSKIDKSMFNIAYSFLKQEKTDNEEILKTLQNLFGSYSPLHTEKLFKRNTVKIPDLYKSCKIILNENSDVKFFVLYTLLDISAEDALYSLKEEEFINTVRRKIGIHQKTFNMLKDSYVKKGLKEERKIKEEQYQKKAMSSFTKYFTTYDAYKILGISPSITKAQLKKAYRTLAKKYHPDKHVGQNAVEIQKSEDKFQEVKEAYDVIRKSKKF